MKFRKILLSFLAIILLASCNKETEVYEKKDVKVDSVFDNIEKKEEDKPEEKKEEKAEDKKEEENKEKPEEEKADENKEEQQNQENQTPVNPQQNQANTKEATVLVNMRETPNTYEENFILSIPQGNRVEFIEEVYQDGVAWSKIKYQNTVGFVRSDLLR